MRICLILVLSTLTGLSLTSCASYDSHFDCKPGKGIGCKSLSEVNKLINEQRLDEEIELTECKNCKKDKNKNNKENQDVVVNPDDSSGSNIETVSFYPENNEIVERSKEKVIKIWFSEYEDIAGNYNSDQVVYSVVEPSKWVKK